MGCTPSRSDIVKNPETKLMDKRITLVDQGGEGFSFPLLIKGSSSRDTEGIRQEEAQFKVHFFKNLSNEEKDVNSYSSSEDPLLSELDQEEKEIEKIDSETEIAISESKKLNKDKHMAEAIMIKKQKSCESEKVDASIGDKSESSKNQKPKNGKKQRSRQGKPGRPCKIKEKSSPSVGQPEKKVDFPDALVKAHQNAYAYLNPNVAKYEAMLSMTDQVTETQLIVQQLVNFLLFRFDGINHLLEEITEDGENLLKEVGENLVWPAGKENPKEQPDLLQQLLQYTVNKMQLLNRTVASLASDVLQESCNFLQSASTSLEEKIKAKQHLDERLVRIIKNLEESAVRSSHHYPDDMTLYSEDSGIGIDNESVKDLNIIDRHGMETNCETIHKCPCNSRDGISMSQDCVLEKQLKNISYSPPQTRNVISSSEVVASKSRSAFLQHQNILKTFNSGHCDVTQESNSFKQNELASISSTNEDSSANSLTEEECDSISLSEKEKNALSKRSITFPAARENRQKSSTKQIDSADNEMILKMKDAISEKIKFVPAKCWQRAWMEDENGKEFPRPSTGSGGHKTWIKQKRTRSEVSLKSHAEDPTLLELQRTQKDLDRRLELFYQLNGKDEINDTLEILYTNELSDPEYFEHVTHRTSTNKLKASLAKNFNILPDPSCRYNENVKCKKSITTGMSSKDLIAKKEHSSGTPKPNTPCRSVKKLIETFSPPESLVKPSSLRTLGPIKCVRKFGLQSISPNLPLPKGFVPLNHKHKVSPLEDTSCKNIRSRHCTLSDNTSMELASGYDTNEDSSEIDIENLPPPPPEMLMEISHESTESSGDIKMEESYLEVADKITRADEQSTTKKITQISPRMKLSFFSLDLLPNKNLSNSPAVNKAPNNGVDTISNKYFLDLNATHMSDCRKREDEMEKVADLYKQSRKIIPLTHPKETSEPNGSNLGNISNSEAPLPEKQTSLNLLKNNEKTSSFISRVSSPVRIPPSSPPNQKRFPSPPLNYRAINQVSSSILHQQPSPSTHSRSTSPPVQRKVISPLPQQNLSNPPVIRKPQSSQNQKVSNLPCHDQEASPPPFATTPSPSISPSQFHRCLQNNTDSKDEPHSASPKMVGNARSIFCLATSSLFEAKPVLSSNINPMGASMAQPEVSTSIRRNSMQLRQLVDQQRMINSATSPQPCLRRSFSDHRPGFQLPLPVFVTAESDPVLNQASMENGLLKEENSWKSKYFSEGKGIGKSSSYPELYIVGQGLQKA